MASRRLRFRGLARTEKRVAAARGFEPVVGQNLERQLKAAVEFVLPLLGEAAGTDHQAALEIAAGDQFLDQQPGHNGLAGAGVVGEQKAQRLARQHGFVDGGNLVQQRLDQRGVHREQRVEQMRKTDAPGLGHQTEERAIAVEAPRPAEPDDLQARFIVAVEQLVGERPARRLVGQLQNSAPTSPARCEMSSSAMRPASPAAASSFTGAASMYTESEI